MKSAEQIKADFPIFTQLINGKPLYYLDNGATSQKPQVVIDAIQNYYLTSNANTHRSIHELASRATICYEHARGVVAKLINCNINEVIFTSGTTDAINKLSISLRANLNSDDEILITEMEHHSNIVPWQQIANQTNAKLKWLPINKDFRLNLTMLKKLVSSKTKIVALTHVSNVLGTINPVKEIIKTIRSINPNCIVVVDAAQSVPHIAVNVQDLDCDFLAFSGHKTIGPTGIGILFGKSNLLKKMEVNHVGGGMILEVSKSQTTFHEAPYKFEAGTPNIAGAVGLAAAIQYLQNIGMENIEEQMQKLTIYGIDALQKIPGLTLLGAVSKEMRASIFSFIIDGVHPHDVGEILNNQGVAIRGGHHCAMPLFEKLGFNGASRASLYIYNSKEDIDLLVQGIREAQRIFKVGSVTKEDN